MFRDLLGRDQTAGRGRYYQFQQVLEKYENRNVKIPVMHKNDKDGPAIIF